MNADWFLVKYMPDPFRAEPKNIGFVRGDEESAEHFARKVNGRFVVGASRVSFPAPRC